MSTPAQRVANARRAYDNAEAACPHWSYEGFDANEEHGCCRELESARRELKAARVAAKAVQS